MTATRPFILLDRDGTLNADPGYLNDPAALRLLPGVPAALARLAGAGFGLVVVTNQSGVGRGFITPDQLAAIHRRLAELLAEAGVTLDGIYACPHRPDESCPCRKPAPGLALAAARDHGFDPAHSIVIGDSPADVGLGHAIGARTILLSADPDAGSGWAHPPHLVRPDLATAAALLVPNP